MKTLNIFVIIIFSIAEVFVISCRGNNTEWEYLLALAPRSGLISLLTPP